MNKKKYIIVGSYGSSNIGDEALLDVILEKLKDEYVYVLTGDVKDTLDRHSSVTDASLHMPFGVRSFFSFKWLKSLKLIKAADIAVLGGGGLFTDMRTRKAVLLWAWQVLWFKMYGKKILMVGNSVGPLDTKIGRMVTKWALKQCDAISVRDNASFELVNELLSGINDELRPKVIQGADLAFSYVIPGHVDVTPDTNYVTPDLDPESPSKTVQSNKEMLNQVQHDNMDTNDVAPDTNYVTPDLDPESPSKTVQSNKEMLNQVQHDNMDTNDVTPDTIVVAPDTIVVTPAPNYVAPDLDPESQRNKTIAINLRPWAIMPEGIEQLIKDKVTAGYTIRLIATEHSDSQILKKYENKQCKLIIPNNYKDLLKELNTCGYAVGMRLHFLIAAAISGCKITAIAYSKKVTEVMMQMEVQYLNIKDIKKDTLKHVFNTATKAKNLKTQLDKVEKTLTLFFKQWYNSDYPKKITND